MRAPSLFKSSLLILALALGQWLTFAHTQQHSVLESKQTCEICLHAQGLDGAFVNALPTLSAPPAWVALSAVPQCQVAAAVPAYYPIRAPPVLVG